MLLFRSENHHHFLYAVRNSLEFPPVLSKERASGQMVARCKTCNGLASAALIFFHCIQIYVMNSRAAAHIILDMGS